MRFVIGRFGRQGDASKMKQGPAGWPVDGGVIHSVAGICDLYLDVEPNRARADAVDNFVEQVVVPCRFGPASSRCSTPAAGIMRYRLKRVCPAD
jgi:hypothetical protein